MPANFEMIEQIAIKDCEELENKEKSYGDSWKQRGGIGAFMMLARKWDRIENQCSKSGYDIFESCVLRGTMSVEELDNVGIQEVMMETIEIPEDGVIDDIRDLRRYLLLVEQHILSTINITTAEDTASAGSGYTAQ